MILEKNTYYRLEQNTNIHIFSFPNKTFWYHLWEIIDINYFCSSIYYSKPCQMIDPCTVSGFLFRSLFVIPYFAWEKYTSFAVSLIAFRLLAIQILLRLHFTLQDHCSNLMYLFYNLHPVFLSQARFPNLWQYVCSQ